MRLDDELQARLGQPGHEPSAGLDWPPRHQHKQQQQHHNSHHHHHHHQKQPREADKQVPVKFARNMCAKQPCGQPLASTAADLYQRRLLDWFYIYAILIASLYVTYAVYYFCTHQPASAQASAHTLQAISEPASTSTSGAAANDKTPAEQRHRETGAFRAAQLDQPEPPATTTHHSNNERLEGKLHLLERYIEHLALELRDVRAKVQEREKCECAQGCSFNGTRYADRSSWTSACDICHCRAGQISCAPQKCPKPACDEPVQVAGQCCPSCMRRCKHAGRLIKHGERVPAANSARRKECRCHDGLIKCRELMAALVPSTSPSPSKLQSKLQSQPTLQSLGQQPQQQQQQLPPPSPLNATAAPQAVLAAAHPAHQQQANSSAPIVR